MRASLLGSVLITFTSLLTHAQGTIKLENNNTLKSDGSGTYKIPIWIDINQDGVRQHVAGSTTDDISIGQWAAINGWGPAYFGLFVPGSNTPFALAVFRSDNNGDFFAPPTSQTVQVPNVLPGERANLVAMAWIPGGPNFGGLGLVPGGMWFFQTQPLGGTLGNGSQLAPPGLAGLGDEVTNAGLVISEINLPNIPEPSSMMLAAVAVGVLSVCRKNKPQR